MFSTHLGTFVLIIQAVNGQKLPTSPSKIIQIAGEQQLDYPPPGTNITYPSKREKEKNRLKSALTWDMLVPKRVHLHTFA